MTIDLTEGEISALWTMVQSSISEFGQPDTDDEKSVVAKLRAALDRCSGDKHGSA